MKDEQLDDLKQYFSTEISQSEARIKSEITADLGGSLNRIISELRTDMNSGFAAIAQIFNDVHDSIDDHETRLTKLEQQVA